MAWYSLFSNFYDGALERLYEPHRAVAYGALAPFDTALVVPCGTGQDFRHLLGRAPGARIVGVDLSEGMASRARRRAAEQGWDVEMLVGDATRLDQVLGPREPFGLVVCSLGLTVVPDPETVFAAAWAALRPGGQMAIFDVWAEQRTFQTWQVEVLARADLNRKVWEPLERVAEDFELRFIDDAKPSKFGGRLFVATGRKS